MRYPLLAFLFVFVIPPFTAHALLTGTAAMGAKAESSQVSATTADASRIHDWKLAAR